MADHERLQSLHRASLLGLVSSYYDTAEIEAYIDYASPMLGELIARGRYHVIEFDNLLVGGGGWSACASAQAWLVCNATWTRRSSMQFSWRTSRFIVAITYWQPPLAKIVKLTDKMMSPQGGLTVPLRQAVGAGFGLLLLLAFLLMGNQRVNHLFRCAQAGHHGGVEIAAIHRSFRGVFAREEAVPFRLLLDAEHCGRVPDR